MPNNRHRGRKDAAHKPIVDELQKRGFVVFDVSGLKGLGFDIVVYGWRWMPFEIKSPGREKQVTKAEQKAQAKAPIPIVSSVEQILKYF